MFDYTKAEKEHQSGIVLEDRKKNGRVRPWRWKRAGSIMMSKVYSLLGMQGKAERMRRCAEHIIFRKYENGQPMQIETAFFCKVRLCPVCSMRRTEKIFRQVNQVVKYIDGCAEYGKLKYIFVTFTVRNVVGGELSSTLDELFKGFHRMLKRKEFTALSKGWFRALEVTHNWEKEEYHPHFHMIVAVSEKYFTRYENYVDHEGWKNLWRSCMGLDYDPWVHVEKVRPSKKVRIHDKEKMGNVIAELAKYTVKENDYLIQWVDVGGKDKVYLNSLEDEKVKEEAYKKMVKTVGVLDSALTGRRLVAFGGSFKDVHKKLNLDDPVDGDMVDDGEKSDDNYKLISFSWSECMGVGVGNYYVSKLQKDRSTISGKRNTKRKRSKVHRP